MPDENGYAFIGRVRALPPEEGGTVPAAAMTAHGSREDRDRALAAGFQRHLPKPFQPADLFALVGDLAGRTPPAAMVAVKGGEPWLFERSLVGAARSAAGRSWPPAR